MKKLLVCCLIIFSSFAVRADQRDIDISIAASQHRVLIGMTADQCRQAWGNPSAVNRTTTAGGTREQWVYRGGSAFHNGSGDYVVAHRSGGYLYLENGVLTSIQD